MESCHRCGATDPHRMYGLMSHWFAAPAGLTLDGGYFYLCPRCFDETIAPQLEPILDKLREHLPAPPPPPTTRGAGQTRPRVSAAPATGNAEHPDRAAGPAATPETGPAPEPGAAGPPSA